MSTEREELDAICRENDGYWPAIRDDLIARGYRKQEPVTDADRQFIAELRECADGLMGEPVAYRLLRDAADALEAG